MFSLVSFVFNIEFLNFYHLMIIGFKVPKCEADPINGFKFLREVYEKAQPGKLHFPEYRIQ